MRAILILPAILVSIVFCTPGLCQSQINQSQLEEVNQSMDLLNGKEPGFLAPNKFKAVQKVYKEYIDAVRGSKSEREIEHIYLAFSSALLEANNQVMKVANFFSLPLKMRVTAQSADADYLAKKSFETAELRLSKAMSKLEERKVTDAEQLGNESIILFQVSRISAIRATLIGSAQAGINEGREKKWDRLAPVSFERASMYLNEVEAALERGEQVTEALKLKAEQGNYEVRHALWLAAKIDTLRRDQVNWETLLLSREALVRQATKLSNISPDFLSNTPDAILSQSLKKMTSRRDSIGQNLDRKDLRIGQLRSTIDSLNTAINQQQIRLASMVENYQRDLQSRKEDLERRRRELDADLRRKMQLDAVAQVQARFLSNEAIVLREEKEVIIRLVGLEFKAGKTDFPEKGSMILDKLAALLLLYPRSVVVVEGHTDSTGKIEKNMALSEERSASVKEYLQANSGLGDDQITSKGFGSNRPIANNTTKEGRAQNRRIDIVVSFESES